MKKPITVTVTKRQLIAAYTKWNRACIKARIPQHSAKSLAKKGAAAEAKEQGAYLFSLLIN